MLPYIKPNWSLIISINCSFNRAFDLRKWSGSFIFWILGFDATVGNLFTFTFAGKNHLSYSNLFYISVWQNPTWRSLDFGMLPDLLDTSASCFVVRIWGGQEEQYTLLIEWKVNLNGLKYTGQQVSSLHYFQHNTFLTMNSNSRKIQ